MDNKKLITKDMIVNRAGLKGAKFQIVVSIIMLGCLIMLIVGHFGDIKNYATGSIVGTLVVILCALLSIALVYIYIKAVHGLFCTVSDINSSKYNIESDEIASILDKKTEKFVKFRSYNARNSEAKFKLPYEENDLQVGSQVIIITNRRKQFITVFNKDNYRV